MYDQITYNEYLHGNQHWNLLNLIDTPYQTQKLILQYIIKSTYDYQQWNYSYLDQILFTNTSFPQISPTTTNISINLIIKITQKEAINHPFYYSKLYLHAKLIISTNQ